MPTSCEPRSLIDRAELARAAGDYATAETLLRDAARLQEADFGPLHRDLANTLNNLGVVYEITNKPADAEICYRKAYAIATAVLAPDDPFAATVRANLKDFCDAQGKPLDESPGFAFGTLPYPFTIVAVSLCGLVLLMLASTAPWFRSSARADSSPAGPTSVSEPSVAPRKPAGPRTVADAATTGEHGPVAASRVRTKAASAPALTVASAELCEALSTGGSRGVSDDWRCDPASRPVDAGALFFYTRLKSANDTRVQHRWYRGARLYQAVDLRVRANESHGYRTYSRHTMSSQSAGNWRVELRSTDGRLLHEERFVVR